MERFVDLHIHTSCSDGTFPPEEVVRMAVEAGLEVIAITDHDTVDGVKRALDEGKGAGIEVIPGVELSTRAGPSDIHILGYYVEVDSPPFKELMEKLRKERFKRAKKIVEKLNGLGVGLSFETVLEVAGEATIGRPHIADALVREAWVESYDEAFRRYIGYDGPAYLPKYEISPEEGIKVIKQAGGIPVFGHPGTARRDELIPRMVRAGLMGIEIFHPLHPPEACRYYKDLAEKYGLICTGGSDFHGSDRRMAPLGSQRVPYEILLDLEITYRRTKKGG
ncbi:MAG TPA: PHP domain-containing protein [Candidatus Latescibacteria bacterium]|nr:PHP domain-containing protein [Candidatus Latescibacterota bacterium]